MLCLLTVLAALAVPSCDGADGSLNPPPPAPRVHLELGEGGVQRVRLSSANHAVVRYSLDGSEADARSGAYLAPVELPCGGSLRAVAFHRWDGERVAPSEPASALLHRQAAHCPHALPSALVPVTQDRDWPTYDWAERHQGAPQSICAAAQRRRWPALTHPAALLAQKGAPCNLVFVGDSITQMWGGEPHDRQQPGAAVWEERFARRAAVNLGYGWDRTENVLWRLRVGGELEGCAGAKLGVLLIGADPAEGVAHNTPYSLGPGTNNLGPPRADPPPLLNASGAAAAAGAEAVLDEMLARLPNAHVIVLAILPRGKPGEEAQPGVAAMQAQIRAANAALEQAVAQRGRASWLDAGAALAAGRGASAVLMPDGVHPNEEGYRLLADALEPAMHRWLGEAA